MKNLFSREVKRTFYNLGKIPKSDGTKFRWLHKPTPNSEVLQNLFYASHKSILSVAKIIKDRNPSRRKLSKLSSMALPPLAATRNTGVSLCKVQNYKILSAAELQHRLNPYYLPSSGIFSKGHVLDAKLGTIPLSDAVTAAFLAKIAFCERGDLFNLIPENVIGGMPGKHITEIIAAAYDKAAVYKTDITGFFRNANKRIVKNAMLHACRKIYLPMLAETLFAREAGSEFTPIIKAIKSDGIILADDFWTNAVQVSGHFTPEAGFLNDDGAASPLAQDLGVLIQQRVQYYRRRASDTSLSSMQALREKNLVGSKNIIGQVFIAGQCRKLDDTLRFTGYNSDISAKKILAEFLLAVARENTGIICVDSLVKSLTANLNLPEEIITAIHNTLSCIATHLNNSIIIPIIGSMCLFKVPKPVTDKSTRLGTGGTVAHRNKSSMLRFEADALRLSMATIHNSQDLHEIVNDGMSGANIGGVTLLLNRELNASYADVLATLCDNHDKYNEVVNSSAITDSAAYASIFSVDAMPNAEAALKSVKSWVNNGMQSIAVRQTGRLQIMYPTSCKDVQEIKVAVLLNADIEYAGALVNKYGDNLNADAISAMRRGRTDDKAIFANDAANTITAVNGFVITNGKDVPLHLLSEANLNSVEYTYKGRVKSTKLNPANAAIISDNPIKQASLREYIAHLEYECMANGSETTLACGVLNMACEAFTPMSLLTGDICASRIIRMPAKKAVSVTTSTGMMQYEERDISYEEAALLYTAKALHTKPVIVNIKAANSEVTETALLMPSGCGDMLLAAKALLKSSVPDKLDKLAQLNANLQYTISHAKLLEKAILKSKISVNSVTKTMHAGNANTAQAMAFSLLTCDSDITAPGPLKSLLAYTDKDSPNTIAVPYGNVLLLFKLTDEAIKENSVNLLDMFLADEYTCIRDNRVTKHSDQVKELVNLACDYALDFYVTANNSLPEGALTSPLFANYIMAEIVDDVSESINSLGGEIYAYMDDISVMFKDKPISNTMFKINKILGAALKKRGLMLNKAKTNMITGKKKREIFGTCFLAYNGPKTNVTVRLTRPDRKKLRARIHNMKKFLKTYHDYVMANRALVPDDAYIATNYPKGFDAQSHLRIPRMLNKLGGSVAWAMSVSTAAYQGLRDSFKTDCVLFFKDEIAPLVRECSAGLVDLDIKGKVKLDQIDNYLSNGGA